MLRADQQVQPESKVQPCTAHALAQDLGALLQRLGVSASIADAAGNQLAASGDASLSLSVRDASSGRRVVVRLCGHTLRVTLRNTLTANEAQRTELDLTPRQRTVIELIADGMRNREIAERLGISLHTVRRHVEALLRRLNVPTRAAAAALMQSRVQPVGALRVRRVA